MLLDEIGLTYDFANNGQEAIDAVENHTYDIVLMDMQMPVMGGIEAAGRIRKNHSNESLPIVAMTANVLPEHKLACTNAGMNDFIGKPVVFESLVEVMEKWLDR